MKLATSSEVAGCNQLIVSLKPPFPTTAVACTKTHFLDLTDTQSLQSCLSILDYFGYIELYIELLMAALVKADPFPN